MANDSVEELMKKISTTTASIAMSLGLVVALGGGVAMASGHSGGSHKPTGALATGSVTCTMHGVAIFAANGSLTIRGNITPSHGAGCTGKDATSNTIKIRIGHFSSPLTNSTTTTVTPAPTSTVTQTCASVPNGTLPDLGNGTIVWNSRPKFAPSTGIGFTGGTASPSTSTNGHLLIAYTSGQVGGGSFMDGTATLSLTSRQTLAQLQSRCESGRFVIAVSGTITL